MPVIVALGLKRCVYAQEVAYMLGIEYMNGLLVQLLLLVVAWWIFMAVFDDR